MRHKTLDYQAVHVFHAAPFSIYTCRTADEASLLSLLPPTCLVVPIRELANQSSFTTTKALLSNKLVQSSPSMDTDINMAASRGRSLSHLGTRFRESSILSTTSSIPYHERMEIQSSNPSWSEQVEEEEASSSSTDNLEQRTNQSTQEPNNGNTAGKQHVISEAPALNNMPSQPVGHEITDSSGINSQSSHYEVPLTYNINQSTEPNSWDGEAHPISIFGSMEFLEIDTKNMYTLLLYIVNYIRSRKVKSGLINNIPQLKGFGWLYGTLFLQFMNPVGTPVMLTVTTIHSGAKSLTNSPPKLLRPNLC